MAPEATRRRRPQRAVVPRVKDAWVWIGSFMVLGLIGGGFTVAAAMLWEYVDIRQIAPELIQAPEAPPEPLETLRPVRAESGFPVALFVSPRNRAFFPDSAWYDGELAAWGSAAEAAGGEVHRIGPADLGSLGADEVLLIPEAPCLSAAEARAIQRHLRDGGGVVANWAFGARDAECAWRGWGAVQELSRAPDVREVEPREGLYLTVPSGSALSPGLSAGTRIELRGEPVVAVYQTGPRVYWSDWASNPAPDGSGGGADGAAVTLRTPSGGRVSWFGFRLDQGATPRAAARLTTLVQNGVAWAAGVPSAELSAWPDGVRAALVPVVEVESEPQNALLVADMLTQERLPGSFFAVSQIVQEDAALGQALIRAGEVGTQTTDHVPLAGRTAQDQRMALRRSADEIRRWVSVDPEGLRPPEELFDQLTLEAWAQSGGRYIVGLNQGRAAVPELHEVLSDTLVLLPRLMKDDYNVFVQDRAVRAARLEESYRAGLDRLASLGGVAVMVGHTQILNSDARVGAYRNVLVGARDSGEWWIASGREVTDWWRRRRQVRVSWLPAEDGVLALEVQGPPESPVDQTVWLNLVIPEGADAMEPWVDGEPVASVLTPSGLQVPVGAMQPGDVRRVELRPSS